MKLSEFWLLNRAKTLQINVGEFRRILGVKLRNNLQIPCLETGVTFRGNSQSFVVKT